MSEGEERTLVINLCIGFLTPAARHELVRGARHIKAITGEYCKTEYAIPVGADCGHVYHHALPDIILFLPNYLK